MLRLARILTDDEPRTYSRRSVSPAESGLLNQIERISSLVLPRRGATQRKQTRKIENCIFLLWLDSQFRSIARSRDCRCAVSKKFDVVRCFFKLRMNKRSARWTLCVIRLRSRRKISPLKSRTITWRCSRKGGCCLNNWRVADWIEDSCHRSCFIIRRCSRFCRSLDPLADPRKGVGVNASPLEN